MKRTKERVKFLTGRTSSTKTALSYSSVSRRPGSNSRKTSMIKEPGGARRRKKICRADLGNKPNAVDA